MVRTGKRVWLWWAALVVYAIVGLAPARGLVLCIGDDGHVALEVASSQDSCFDCLPEVEVADGCCTSEDVTQAGCSCADILLQIDDPRVVRSFGLGALGALDLPPTACVGANATLGPIASALGALELRARPTLPPGTRVPTSLILRV